MPTDTVYGLACSPYREGPVQVLSEAKRRSPEQPIALLAASVDVLLECVPELRGGAARPRGRCCPGRTRSSSRTPLAGTRGSRASGRETIGVRVPDARRRPGACCSTEVGAVAATSANLHGGARPAATRGRAGGAPRGGGRARRRRASRHAVHGARSHRPRAPRAARGRGRRRGRLARVEVVRAQ